MREIRMSGLMSGDGKRGGAPASVLAPILDSTKWTNAVRLTGVEPTPVQPIQKTECDYPEYYAVEQQAANGAVRPGE
jgi:hypothetical protein